jgi:hypothetical protein
MVNHWRARLFLVAVVDRRCPGNQPPSIQEPCFIHTISAPLVADTAFSREKLGCTAGIQLIWRVAAQLQKALCPCTTACHGKQACVSQRRPHSLHRGLSVSTTFPNAIPTRHRQDILLACTLSIGMIFRSSSVCASSAVPRRAPTTHLSEAPTAVAPAPHVRTDKVGRLTAFPGEPSRPCFTLTVRNLDNPDVCMY